jgi:hypothetical protein
VLRVSKRTLAPLKAGSWFLLGWVSGIESLEGTR